MICDETRYIDGVYEEGIEHIDRIYGYWLFSSNVFDSTGAYATYYRGYIIDNKVNENSIYGIRVVNVNL